MTDKPKPRGMGYRPGSVDERDYKLGFYIAKLAAPKQKGSVFYYNPMRLDQGQEGSCVGHGWTQAINSTPKMHNYDHAFAVNIYERAQDLDEWPGSDYEGTSVRAGGDACRERELIKTYAYASDIEQVAVWILNKGPVVIGIDWYTGMGDATKDNDYFIEPSGRVRGGHCVCLDGVRFNRKSDDYFRGLNSWGPEWGYNGRFRIRVPDLEKLLSDENASACTYVEG